jgi:FkbM family methyltransferase
MISGLSIRTYAYHLYSELEPTRYSHKQIITCIERACSNSKFPSLIEIGALFGEVSIPLSYLFEKCVAFEPNPERFGVLKKRAESVSNLQVFNIGLGDKNENVKFYSSSTDPGDSCVFERADLKRVGNVQIEKLDDVLRDFKLAPPFLIKMDVQGYESHVLRGATKTLDLTGIVVSEFWPWGASKSPDHDAMGLVKFLHNRGFEIFDIWGHKLSVDKLKKFAEIASRRSDFYTDLFFKKRSFH